MREPSEKRKRTLALHDWALQFTNTVNCACPQYFTNQLSAIFASIVLNMRRRLEREKKNRG